MSTVTWNNLAGIGDSVILFSAGCVLFVLLAWFGPRGARQWNFRKLARGEEGASYTLSVALVLPFYMVVLATIIECALMMMVKLGTVNAAYAAARAASVWLPAEVEPEQREEMLHLAAAQAMTPFASSKEIHLEPTGNTGLINATTNRVYAAALNGFARSNVPFEYLAKKRLYALAATEVAVEKIHPNIPAKAAVRVTVTYEKPIDLPVVGLALGQRASWPGARFSSRKISSMAILHLEIPKSTTHTLGINYDSWEY